MSPLLPYTSLSHKRYFYNKKIFEMPSVLEDTRYIFSWNMIFDFVKRCLFLKKILLSIFIIFVIISICAGSTVKFANDRVYNLLYPCEEKVFDENHPGIVSLKNGDYFTLGTYNGERLVWECVLENHAQCEKIIEFRQYDADCSNWASSDLREWLNSNDGFFGKSLLNKEFISGNIYVLSQDELEQIGSITKQPSLPAIRKSNSKYLFLRKYCWYWTSSSISTNSQSVATVTQNGSFYKTLPTDQLTGVCPAFVLKSTDVHILGGEGSKQKPYVIG